jgi:hypothetical protein
MTSYAEKLRDPRWRERRLEILERAQFRCEECGEEAVTLHVHHKVYRRGAEPWEYFDHELIALCEGCHADRHAIESVIREALGYAGLHDISRMHLALMVLGFCAAASKESENRCVELADRISDHGYGSYWFICGYTAATGDPRMHKPKHLLRDDLDRWIHEMLAEATR